MSVVYGIGGRDFAIEDGKKIFAMAKDRGIVWADADHVWGEELDVRTNQRAEGTYQRKSLWHLATASAPAVGLRS